MQQTESPQRPLRPSTPPGRSHPFASSFVQSYSGLSLTRERNFRDSLSPLSLVRRTRSQMSKLSPLKGGASATSTLCRAEPDSVPSSPTMSIFTTGLPTTNRLAFNSAPLFAEMSMPNQAPINCIATTSSLEHIEAPFLSSSPSPLHVNRRRKTMETDSWRAENEKAKEKAQGWLKSQQMLENLSSSTSSRNPPSVRSKARRHRAYSESSSKAAIRGSDHWGPLPPLPLGALCKEEDDTSFASEHLLDSILDCAQDEDEEIQSRHSGSPSSEIQSRCGESAFSLSYYQTDEQDTEIGTHDTAGIKTWSSTAAKETRSNSNGPLSFSVMQDDQEGNFNVTQSELDRLQYSDLEDSCFRSLGTARSSADSKQGLRKSRIFLILSSQEALELRLIKSVMEQKSCNLVLLDAWTTSVSTSMQELLVKNNFRLTNEREGKVRLFLLEDSQSLPHHITATKEFWKGWSSLSLDDTDQNTLSITIQSGVATIVSSRQSVSPTSMVATAADLKQDRFSLRVDTACTLESPTTTSSKERKEEVASKESTPLEDEQGHARLNALLRESIQSSLSSRFSMESFEEGKRKSGRDQIDSDHIPQVRQVARRLQKAKRSAFAFRCSNKGANARQSKVISIKSGRSGARKNARLSIQVVGSHRKSSSKLLFKTKQGGLGGGLNGNAGFSGGLRKGNQALRKAAGFLVRSNTIPLTLNISDPCSTLPATPTTASISLHEWCSQLPQSSVDNLLCRQSDGVDDHAVSRPATPQSLQSDMFKEEIQGEEEEEEIDSFSRSSFGDSTMTSVGESPMSKRRGWIGSTSLFPYIEEAAFEMEEDEEEESGEEEQEQDQGAAGQAVEKKASENILEELSEERQEEQARGPVRSRSNSVTGFFKTSFTSPSVSTGQKGTGDGSMLRKQLYRMGGKIRDLKRSRSESFKSGRPGGVQAAASIVRDSVGASISLYSRSSAEEANDSPLTLASTAESSPCLTDTSPLFSTLLAGQQQHIYSTSSPLKSASPTQTSSPLPPRRRLHHSSSLLNLAPNGDRRKALSINTAHKGGTLNRCQSMKSMGWLCSDEDLEPEVRDCVSSLSGRIVVDDDDGSNPYSSALGCMNLAT